jgi:hypothetical protein
MSLHGYPNGREMLELVREFLRDEVVPQTSGELSYRARIAANLVAVVMREADATGEPDLDAVMRDLGVDDEQALALAIRERRVLAAHGTAVSALRELTRARLEVWNPRYLDAPADDDPRSV